MTEMNGEFGGAGALEIKDHDVADASSLTYAIETQRKSRNALWHGLCVFMA